MKNILVTGGGGFVGKALVRMALDQGLDCRVIGRNRYPDIEALGARCLCGDIRDASFLNSAVRDVDTVFHTAALAGIWGPWRDYRSINVLGTRNVIEACRKNSIPHLVYTSTPSVVFNRVDIEYGDESLPYPDKFLCNYAKSKVLAEREVLAANGVDFSTCAIRPHLVWGPGDPHLIPRLLAKGRAGKLKRVGNGGNLVDITYMDNVAHAHLLAGTNLSNDGSASGKAYFVSQEKPVNLWDWINELFLELAIDPVTQSVPFPVAFGGGALLEAIHYLVKPNSEPQMTRFLAEQLAKSHYFSNENIQKDLGYEPLVSIAEGMQRLLEWIKANDI